MNTKQLPLCMLILLGNISAHAFDFGHESLFFNITDVFAKTVEVTFVRNNSVNSDYYYDTVSIPESVSSYGVTYTVTAIGDSAFHTCSRLISITIPESVTSIGNRAFQECTGLTSITIPESVTSIGDEAFAWCTGLTSITIPKNVMSIGNSVFEGCSNLTSIVVNNRNTTYDSRDNCNAIIETSSSMLIASCKRTVIPESVTSIGNRAFYGCTGLTSITIPESVTSIGDEAFAWCTGLTSITIPSSVTSIGNFAFWWCGLTSIIIPESVTSISEGAFFACFPLTSVTIPESVTSIGNKAFGGCNHLTSINIPESVTSIGDDAFSGCTSLTSVTIPENVTSIGNRAFLECTGLTSITIPGNVTSIGDGVFKDCRGLTSVTIPKKVTMIGKQTFSGCWNLQSLTIPESVTSIGDGALYDCRSLVSIVCLATTPPICYSGTFSSVPTSICVLTVPNESVPDYQAADYWKEFAKIMPLVQQCATPTISYADGIIKLLCETEGSKCFCTISAIDNATEPVEVTSEGITISKQYIITAYATAERYTQSEPATLTITLGDGDLNGDGETNVSDVTKLVNIILGNK